jgi:hypothetical protein
MNIAGKRKGKRMATQSERILRTVAQELHLSEDDLLRQGLHIFLERQLRAIKAEIFDICGRYGIRSVEEMDSRYQDGTLEEADSWRDFQRLDHLEYKRNRLLQLIEAVS